MTEELVLPHESALVIATCLTSASERLERMGCPAHARATQFFWLFREMVERLNSNRFPGAVVVVTYSDDAHVADVDT